MTKVVVLVGHCGPDASYLRIAVSKAAPDARVVQVNDQGALNLCLEHGPRLLLINRQLEGHFREYLGVELITRLAGEYPGLGMMLISNYADAQSAARAAGAVEGFGKAEIGQPKVTELLRRALATVDAL